MSTDDPPSTCSETVYRIFCCLKSNNTSQENPQDVEEIISDEYKQPSHTEIHDNEVFQQSLDDSVHTVAKDDKNDSKTDVDQIKEIYLKEPTKKNLEISIEEPTKKNLEITIEEPTNKNLEISIEEHLNSKEIHKEEIKDEIVKEFPKEIKNETQIESQKETIIETNVSTEDIFDKYDKIERQCTDEEFDNLSLQDVDYITKNQPEKQTKSTGEVKLRLVINRKDTSQLIINVVDAMDYARPSSTTSSIKTGSTESIVPILAYSVHITHLPARKQRIKTKMRQGPDPYFDERIKFTKINLEDISNWILRIRLYGSMRNSMTTVIGEGYLPLKSIDVHVKTEVKLGLFEFHQNAAPYSYDNIISSQICKFEKMGSVDSMDKAGEVDMAIEGFTTSDPELLIGLSYNFNTGRLTVEIVKGNKFPKLKENKLPDTYVKLSLMNSRGEELESCKTTLKKSTDEPVFEEKFVFQVMVFQLTEVSLSIGGFTKIKMGKKQQFGKILIGNKGSTDEEITHWSNLCESKACDQILRWHTFQIVEDESFDKK